MAMRVGGGVRVSFTPHASPGRGQAPALQGSHTIIRGRCYSLSRWSRKLAPEIHFRTNRSSRLAPAHQGMKIGAPVDESSLRWLGIRVGCRTTGSGGQAPTPLDSGFRRSDRWEAK